MTKAKEISRPKGIDRARINPKTGKKEYKCRYRYLGSDGKRHQSETRWCDSADEALRVKKEDLRMHEEQLKQREAKKAASLKGTLRNAFELFVGELKEEADASNYQEQITGKMSLHRDANTLCLHYIPDEIACIKLSKMSTSDLARWVTLLNREKKAVKDTDSVLSGTTVRKYRGIILRFNNWLDLNGYYHEPDFAVVSELKISRVKVKKKSVGARNNRNYPTFDEFKKITDYYKSQNLGIFKNMYWYTFYTVLFYSGMRVSEIIGLRWKNIDFEAEGGLGVINIRNAIDSHEKRETVNKRLKNNIEFTKNQQSIRKITIWAAYRQLLKDFKEDSIYEFKYSPSEIDNAFVFTNITARDPKNRTGFQHHNNLLRETDRLSKILDLPKYDNQMFRHACAYFLILDQKLAEDDVYRYFGHQDSEMLKQIYAKLSIDQNMQKTNQSLKSLITNNEFVDQTIAADHAARLERLKVGEAQTLHITKTRTTRTYNQILRAIEKHQTIYYYKPEDQTVIDKILLEHPQIKDAIELKKK